MTFLALATVPLALHPSPEGFWLFVYGSIVTPLYEEFLFRGRAAPALAHGVMNLFAS